mmetsp:Transcript_99629/g.277411  ORF Transcript_99629/g.277411 Transcript_99629/m.277411 type:complete len:202 (+) Transcript_99629:208-813(+)
MLSMVLEQGSAASSGEQACCSQAKGDHAWFAEARVAGGGGAHLGAAQLCGPGKGVGGGPDHGGAAALPHAGLVLLLQPGMAGEGTDSSRDLQEQAVRAVQCLGWPRRPARVPEFSGNVAARLVHRREAKHRPAGSRGRLCRELRRRRCLRAVVPHHDDRTDGALQRRHDYPVDVACLRHGRRTVRFLRPVCMGPDVGQVWR